MKSLFEQMGGTYRQVGDYLIPNLSLPEKSDYQIGKYGRLRRNYLKEYHPVLFANFLTSGTLHRHLAEIDQACNERMEIIISDMAKRGYDVTVFEALHEIGGVLKYGIPEFRLPNKIVDVEIEGLRKMGVKFLTNCIVGKTISYEDLHTDGFKGIFAASGAGLPNFMNIPGENLVGVT